ncbi:hypothetical protein [Paracoccus onubensis]|uniref:Uncharacterized protein n=1 Tax=Paracoccus onubensis TaxID=1675788 RepID=A0A418SZP2_9RHOB|nr:hypothetical protein [Paracoccus onubensis]RJE86398.1 hypothetical protein D3P04_06595 [Paracoccus onubensis]
MNYSLGELVSMIGAAIGGIFWLARLEGKVKKNAEDVTRLEQRIDRERADTRDALDDLKDMMLEQNRDIKILLGRGHQVHWNDKTHPPR